MTSTAALMAACGGGDSGPGPLKHTLEDRLIARVPVDEKQSVIRAQQDYNISEMELGKAEADLDEVKVEVGVARNELAQARLGEKSARQNHDAAKKSGDMNRVNRAARDVRAAELSRRAAEQRVNYLKAQIAYLQTVVRRAKEEMYAKQARYELAKAKVARDKDIRPAGFNYDVYDKQASERDQRVQTWKAKVKAEETRMGGEKKKWQSLEAEAKQARGESGGDDTAKPAPASKPAPTPAAEPADKAPTKADDADDEDDAGDEDDADAADDEEDDLP